MTFPWELLTGYDINYGKEEMIFKFIDRYLNCESTNFTV